MIIRQQEEIVNMQTDLGLYLDILEEAVEHWGKRGMPNDGSELLFDRSFTLLEEAYTELILSQGEADLATYISELKIILQEVVANDKSKLN